jgi:hypothetical protein
LSFLKLVEGRPTSAFPRGRCVGFGSYLDRLEGVGLGQQCLGLDISRRGFVNAPVTSVRDAYGFRTTRLVLVEVGLGDSVLSEVDFRQRELKRQTKV